MKIYREFRFILLVIFVVLGVRSFTYDHYHIPSGSLLPTNAIGDHILVDKMIYGIKVPYSEFFNTFLRFLDIDKEINTKYITKQQMPKKGDIVVFEYPKNRDTLYVKRTIATEGDVVEIVGNGIFVNGEVLKKSLVKNNTEFKKLFPENNKNINIFKEELNKKTYFVTHDKDIINKKNLSKITVPKDHIFVLGDNRDHSLDSRYWGFVHKKYIRGKAMMVLFSFEVQFEPLHIITRFNRSGNKL